MAFITEIKWVVLSVVTLFVASIIIHLSLAKLWTVNIVQYRAMPILHEDFASTLGRQVGFFLYLYMYPLLVRGQVFFVSLKLFWLYLLEMLQGVRNKKLWDSIKSLEGLQPNANARSNYSGKILSLIFLTSPFGYDIKHYFSVNNLHLIMCLLFSLTYE